MEKFSRTKMNFQQFVDHLNDIVSDASKENQDIANFFESMYVTIESDQKSNFDNLQISKITFDIEFGHTQFFVNVGQQSLCIANISNLAGKIPYVDSNLKPSLSYEHYKQQADGLIQRLLVERPNILEDIKSVYNNAKTEIPTDIQIKLNSNAKVKTKACKIYL